MFPCSSEIQYLYTFLAINLQIFLSFLFQSNNDIFHARVNFNILKKRKINITLNTYPLCIIITIDNWRILEEFHKNKYSHLFQIRSRKRRGKKNGAISRLMNRRNRDLPEGEHVPDHDALNNNTSDCEKLGIIYSYSCARSSCRRGCWVEADGPRDARGKTFPLHPHQIYHRLAVMCVMNFRLSLD